TIEEEEGVEVPQRWLADHAGEAHPRAIRGRHAPQGLEDPSLGPAEKSGRLAQAAPGGGRGGDEARLRQEASAADRHERSLARTARPAQGASGPGGALPPGPFIETPSLCCETAPQRQERCDA